MKQLVFLFAAVLTLAFTSGQANAQLFGRVVQAQPAVTYYHPTVAYGYQPPVAYSYQPSVTYSYQPAVRNYSPNVTQNPLPIVNRSYSSSPVTNRMPQPISGYGSNLHRNYMIRRAQKKWAQTGIQPQNTANIRWSR